LQSEGFENDGDLDEVIKGLESALKRGRKKDPEADDAVEEPSFPLLELPDDEVCLHELNSIPSFKSRLVG
jgi:actin-related protein 5